MGEFGFWSRVQLAGKSPTSAKPDVLTPPFSQLRKTSPLQSDKRFGALLGLAILDYIAALVNLKL